MHRGEVLLYTYIKVVSCGIYKRCLILNYCDKKEVIYLFFLYL